MAIVLSFEQTFLAVLQRAQARGGAAYVNELKSMIMAQIERWRQASYMQVERERPFGAE